MNTLNQVFLGRNLSRRAVLGSALTAAGSIGLLPGLISDLSAASSSTAKRRSLILLWQDGGASHFETFDPKPYAPSEYRGELEAISTAVPDVSYCEVLPRLAALADRTSIIRSLHQPSSGHVDGSHNVLTGRYNETVGSRSRYPDVASVISQMRSQADSLGLKIGQSTDPRLALGLGGNAAKKARPDSLPGYIGINQGLHRGGPAFLGPLHAAFQVAGDPAKPGFVVQNLQSVGSAVRFHDRRQMLTQLDRSNSLQSDIEVFEQFQAFNGFQQQAVELLSGGVATRAFDLSREQPQVHERYGRHLAGQQCLLSRRLVEAGVGVVAVRFSPDGRGDYDRTMIGWDDHAVHGNIFSIMQKRGPQFDQSVSALIEDLEDRGLQDDVVLVVVGEFGRTPRIHVHKGCPGREHWGPAGCALVYGGGLTMGQVIGSTTDKGERPLDRPVSYQDLLATIYYAVGVNPEHTIVNHLGRPVPILSTGAPITELTGAPQVRAPKSATPPDGDYLRRNHTRAAAAAERPVQDLILTLPTGATVDQLTGRGDLTQLETLVAHDSALNDDSLAHLAECHNLKHLHLNGAAVTNAGLQHLCGLTTLETLNLTGTRVTDSGLIHLKDLTRLKRLAFNGTTVSLGGVVRLFVEDQHRTLGAALTAMNLTRRDRSGNIVTIDVAGSAFGDNEMRHLAQMPMLRELHLAATAVTDKGMPFIRQFSGLEELYLAKCTITDAGLAHIAGLTRLRTINLYGTQITTAGLQHLMRLTHLRSLLITDVKLDPAAVNKLKSTLPRLTVTDFTPA
ncbi:MAG: DUF1501 domain-containing protein [Planctomycetaceae bacterium]